MTATRREHVCQRLAAAWVLAAALFFAGCGGVRMEDGDRPAVMDEWGRAAATPGVALAIWETGRTTVRKSELVGKVSPAHLTELGETTVMVSYVLDASGIPQGKTYRLWRRDVKNPRPEPFPRTLRADDSGRLVTEQGTPLRNITLNQVGFARGQAISLALVSTDNAVRAFARAIPHPIEAKQDRCRLWLELISPKGTLFTATAEGFEPGEEVATESRSNGEILRGRQRAESDGKLPRTVLAPAAVSRQQKAGYTVSGRACKLTVDYEWGPPALQPQ